MEMQKRHSDSDKTRAKRGKEPLCSRECHDTTNVTAWRFPISEEKKKTWICNLPARLLRDLRDRAAVNRHCHVLLQAIWPAKGLDLGLLDPASALHKTPSSAAHALICFFFDRARGVVNGQRHAVNHCQRTIEK